jgi:hypothetical protein
MKILRFSALMTALLTVSLLASPASAADTSTVFTDGFESFPVSTWQQDTTYGAWRAVYDGYGQVGIASTDSHVLMEAPKASTSPGETHAGLVRSVQSYGDVDVTVRMRTVKQLRTPAPNAWEVAWLNWNYRDDQTFYYILLKPSGWELGKVDGTRADPAGPACVWPEYANCAYPGAQRFLATGSSPAFPVGPWYTVNVRQVANQMSVAVDGAPLVSFTDDERPYTAGQVSLYNEDSHVEFDDVRIESLGALPPQPAPVVPLVQTSPSAPIQRARKFSVRWSAKTAAVSYDVVYRRASFAYGSFGAPQTLRSQTSVTSASFAGSPGYTYCFRARSRDALGGVSAFGRETCAARPVDERVLRRRGPWTAGTNSKAYLGTYLRATKRGASLSRAGAGVKQIWLVVTKCPGCGVVDVYVGGTRVARLNLSAARTMRQQVVRAVTLPSPRSGVVTLRVASARRLVVIEGLGLVRA